MNARIAIVGCGPRGHFALEALLLASAGDEARLTSVTVFDDSRFPGSGPNYAPDQTRLNLVNIPLRKIPLRERAARAGAAEAFPSFQQWYVGDDLTPDELEDRFPPRASIGEYLIARFASLLDSLPEHVTVTLVEDTVGDVTRSEDGLKVHASGESYGDFDHVLLTIGHQSTGLDQSMSTWREHSRHNPLPVLFSQPYPTEPISASPLIRERSTVAVRGMGLSMIDVVKALTEGRGGVFTRRSASDHVYRASGREAYCLLPFSLDGLPVAPKPVNATVDRRFEPVAGELQALEERLQSALHDQGDDALRAALVRHVGHLSAAVFERMPAALRLPTVHETTVATAVRWLDDEATRNDCILAIDMATDEAMRRFLHMATGETPSSLDYCIGQVWRHVQPVIYRCFSHGDARPDSIAAAIALDRRMKRYAFGPPVVSVAQLLALHAAGILRFVVADDPDIVLRAGGWELRDEDSTRLASVMIESVLDSTALNAVNSPLVTRLVAGGVLDPVHDDLGARTDATGEAMPVNGVAPQGISLIGRLATGAIFEADALDECTGPELPRWAESL